MKKLTATVKQTYFLLTTLLIVSSITVAGCTKIPLSLQIDSPEDGAEFSVNVQKVSGVVSDPKATVWIDDVESKVAQDGTFYAYIDLKEGENNIEVKAARGTDTHSETITATFTPALAVYLDLGTRSEFDFNVALLPVSGWVSDAGATVAVNGYKVQVAEDGSFSAQVKLKQGSNSIEVVATRDGEEDSWYWYRTLNPDGTFGPPAPGQGRQYYSHLTGLHEVQLKAGESTTLDVVLEVGKKIRTPEIPEISDCQFFRHPTISDPDKIPLPEGVEISMEPCGFMVYPNTTYHLTIIITSAPDLLPILYPLGFEMSYSGRKWMGGRFTVNVERATN